MIEICIPATTANLGPGFDTLGAAVTLYSTIRFQKYDADFLITGCPIDYCGSDNLIYTSYLYTLAYFNHKILPIHIHVKSEVPPSRGLGSSATCVVAGVTGAFSIMDMPLDKTKILQIATMIEGHPDNVAPAIFGGLVASLQSCGNIYTQNFKVHTNLKFYAFIPEFALSTQKSREVLPKTIEYKDAIFNISRVPLLLKGLETNNKALIQLGLQDALHQPYRKALIDEYNAIEKICKDLDFHGIYLSGAGPTIMGITDDDNKELQVQRQLNKLKHQWNLKKFTIDNIGMRTKGGKWNE